MTAESVPSTNADRDEEFQRALMKVTEEFTVLTAGTPKMSVEESIELREYIRKRTDLEKPDEKLTPEQRAWKMVFVSLDEQIGKSLGKDEKQRLDGLRLEMDKLDLVSQNVDKLLHLGRQIEEQLIRQRTYVDIHFDTNDNNYRKNEERLAAFMLAESTPKEKSVEIARSILKMAETYKQFMVKGIFDYQDKIRASLHEFVSMFEHTPFTVAGGDERVSKLQNLFGEWLSLTESVHKERLKVITAVRNLVELDTIIPNHIIKHNGDKTAAMDAEDFKRRGETALVLIKDARSKENEIEKKRVPVSVKVFGEPDSYIKVEQDKAPPDSQQKATIVNPLKGKTWFRFAQVLYIIACVLAGLATIGLLFIDSRVGLILGIALAVFFFLIRKGFYYVVLGRTTWK
jgi:hypothetical protein